MKMKRISRNSGGAAWLIFGGLLAMGATMLFMREIPSMRREIHLLRM
jgi:hypothetical protein